MGIINNYYHMPLVLLVMKLNKIRTGEDTWIPQTTSSENWNSKDILPLSWPSKNLVTSSCYHGLVAGGSNTSKGMG